MTIRFYKCGDFCHYKELTDCTLSARAHHGRAGIVLAGAKTGKFPVYRLDASEHIVEAE